MKVKDLIKMLMKLPKNANILVKGNNGAMTEDVFVTEAREKTHPKNKVVFICDEEL